jgi:hypothetical protein
VTVCFVNVKNSGCLTRIPCLISSSNLQWLVHRHLYYWTLEMTVQIPAHNSNRSTSFINNNLFVRFNIVNLQ